MARKASRLLKSTLDWLIKTDRAGHLDAELAYVTGGMSWDADYNVVLPAKGDALDVLGWVTMDNQSGKGFTDAKIKLMAGDVSKVDPNNLDRLSSRAESAYARRSDGQPTVTQKDFDEYHLYELQRPVTLRDHEIKQVEFVRATNVASRQLYIYDGLKIDERYRNWGYDNIRTSSEYGSQSNTKVAVMREFDNKASNNLGMPLPAGRLRFYRRDADGQLEFTGENLIDHTPKDETVRVFTGNAFDLIGERKRTNFKYDSGKKEIFETFEMTLRNHKKTPIEVRVVEHLFRWTNWEISEKSQDFKKTDAQTIEFRVQIAPDEEKKVTYTAHYDWK